ncbi:MAG: WD40 repeat domain-containing protein, partial [Pyrinomonadaceae bacterium]
MVAVLLPILILPLTFGVSPSNGQEQRGIELSRDATQTSQVAPVPSSTKPELVIQAGHTKPINAVAFSPDGRWLASGGKDDTIKIWDIATGYVLRTLYAHSSNVNALAISPDGKFLASASGNMTDKRDVSTFKQGGIVGGLEDNTVRIWDVHTGRQVRTLRGHELPVGGVAFSKDGRSLTSASGDSIKVWDISTGSELRSQNTKYDKSGMEKYDSFRSFSIFGRDKRETEQAKWQKKLKLSASKIVVNSDGQLAAVGQPDKAIRIYDAKTGRELR